MDVIQTLLEMNGGAVAEELNRDWSEVRAAVTENGGKGELTIKLSIKATGHNKMGGVSQVELAHATSIKKPKLKTGAAFFYVDMAGNLTRKDPRQQELDMIEPNAPAKKQETN